MPRHKSKAIWWKLTAEVDEEEGLKLATNMSVDHDASFCNQNSFIGSQIQFRWNPAESKLPYISYWWTETHSAWEWPGRRGDTLNFNLPFINSVPCGQVVCNQNHWVFLRTIRRSCYRCWESESVQCVHKLVTFSILTSTSSFFRPHTFILKVMLYSSYFINYSITGAWPTSSTTCHFQTEQMIANTLFFHLYIPAILTIAWILRHGGVW